VDRAARVRVRDRVDGGAAEHPVVGPERDRAGEGDRGGAVLHRYGRELDRRSVGGCVDGGDDGDDGVDGARGPDDPGPAATITCGSGAYCMVLVNALVQNNTSGAISSVGFEISGATTLAAGSPYLSITTSAANQNVTMGACRTVIGMTGGSNTFTMKYFVGAGTGTLRAVT
jgi:hypothetical protein